MAVVIRRTRWAEGATKKEIQEAAEHEEKKDAQTLIKLLLQYFKFPEAVEHLIPECEEFVKRTDITPVEAADLYAKLCFFKEEDRLKDMEVGDSVYCKYKIYWVNPVQYGAYIFEYEDSDSEDYSTEE